jgi:hypothetical protein
VAHLARSPEGARRRPARHYPAPPVSRSALIPLVVTGAIVFLAISFGLARWLTTESRERGDVVALLRAQARGDARAMLARLDGCARDRPCAATVNRNARRLKRPGEVKVLAYDSATSYALGTARGPTRVAWTVIDRGLPVVQCVDVERRGTVLAGRAISLRRLSPPIDRQASC